MIALALALAACTSSTNTSSIDDQKSAGICGAVDAHSIEVLDDYFAFDGARLGDLNAVKAAIDGSEHKKYSLATCDCVCPPSGRYELVSQAIGEAGGVSEVCNVCACGCAID